jgi:hypothetical protein
MTTISVREPSTGARARLTLERRIDGQLWATHGGLTRPVRVQRCFPWSEPGRYVSLRDEDREVAFVDDPESLDAASRRALEDTLVEAGFVFEVTRVHAIEEEVEIRRWQVTTVQGTRTFATRLDDWPRALPHGGFLLRDVASDLYRIPEPARLDRRSRALLWAFVD